MPAKSEVETALGKTFNLTAIILCLYLLCIYLFQPTFFSAQNLLSMVYYTCLLVPAVLGVNLLMILGQFDLSIGAVAALCGIVSAVALSASYSLFTSILFAVGVGALFGLTNWLLIIIWRIPALIGTLITMGAARAMALALSDGQVVGGLPGNFGEIVIGASLAQSPVIPIGIFLVVILEVLTRRHLFFRRFYHIGSNAIAAANCGVRVSRFQAFGFVLCGLGAAWAGIFQSARTLSASPLIFPDLALESIAACVIGGAKLSGGKGRPIGAFIGMLIVVISRNLAILAGVDVYWRELAISLVLLAAVLLNVKRS